MAACLASVRTRRPKLGVHCCRDPACTAGRLQNLFGLAICVGCLGLRFRLLTSCTTCMHISPTVFDCPGFHPQGIRPGPKMRPAPLPARGLDSVIRQPGWSGPHGRQRPSWTTARPCAGKCPCWLPVWPCSTLRSTQAGCFSDLRRRNPCGRWLRG
jgi:hypothetical protein